MLFIKYVSLRENYTLIFLLLRLILFLEFVACWFLFMELVTCWFMFLKLIACWFFLFIKHFNFSHRKTRILIFFLVKPIFVELVVCWFLFVELTVCWFLFVKLVACWFFLRETFTLISCHCEMNFIHRTRCVLILLFVELVKYWFLFLKLVAYWFLVFVKLVC